LVGTSLIETDLKRTNVFSSAVLFVVGFSVVFAIMGVVLGSLLQGAATEALRWLSRLAGTVIIILGLHLSGLLRVPALDRQYSPGLGSRTLKPGYFTPFLFGASFAVAWTPCVGPVLGSVLALASARPVSAFPLLLAYAFGLGAPFLLVGLFPSQGFAFIKRHLRWARRIHTAFGVLLIGMGVLVFTEQLSLLANFEAQVLL
jgi:cytochrome c-type biogenesis protein